MTGHSDALRHKTISWPQTNWGQPNKNVRRLQVRIAKAVSNSKWRKAKSLQHILTHSYSAKMLAVKRVTSNKGARTAGIDNVRWKTHKQKKQAVFRLKPRGYKAAALRRTYIRKKSGAMRPLSIPTMHDRAMQALYARALIPIAETTADPNSYAFRISRCCQDAIAQCFNALSKPNSAEWVLEADIKGCYDNMNHEWMLNNIPMDKRILRQWLKAGYIEDECWHQTEVGCPQGGIISPVLANMTLDGLEEVIRKAVPRTGSKVNFIRYADDSATTASNKALLIEKVIPAIKEFLKVRGLELSEEKTKVSSIYDGFNFLGQNIRKYKKTLLIKPSKESAANLLDKTRKIIRKHRGRGAAGMVQELSPIIRGWCNYHQYSICSKAFSRIDWMINNSLMRWAKRTHPKKGKHWVIDKYFNSPVAPKGVFIARTRNKLKQTIRYHLYKASQTKVSRFIKVRSRANPFMTQDDEYFASRKQAHMRSYSTKGLRKRYKQSKLVLNHAL